MAHDVGNAGRVWEEDRVEVEKVWKSDDGITVRGLLDTWSAEYDGYFLGDFQTLPAAMTAADSEWPWKPEPASVDPMIHVKHMMRNVQEIGDLHESGLRLRFQLQLIRDGGPNPGGIWASTPGSAPLDLSPDECAHLDTSWTARLEALDVEIAERTEKLMSTPPREWGEGL